MAIDNVAKKQHGLELRTIINFKWFILLATYMISLPLETKKLGQYLI